MANSAIAAIQNFRDADWLDAEFLTALDRDILTTADGYLTDGLMNCICPKILDRFGHAVESWDPAASEVALATGEIVTGDDWWQDGYVAGPTSVEKPGAPVWQCCKAAPTHIAEFDDGSAIYSCKGCASNSPVTVYLNTRTMI